MANQKGQILLITVMVLATVITVVLSLSFKSTIETQTTKLEEEAQRALAAAEAGIEAALKQQGTVDISLLPGLSDFTGQATVETTTSNTFITPLLQKDEQYTFYLADYPSFNNSWSGNLTIYYDSENVGCNNISLELTLIYGNSPSYQIKRYIADTGGKFNSNTDNIGQSLLNPIPIEEVSFHCSTSPVIITNFPNAKLLIIRSFFSGTKIGFQGSNNFPNQGKMIVSEAKSKTGVTKKVQLFQSYPQIPAEFFVTSF